MREIIKNTADNQSDKRWDQLKGKMKEAYNSQVNVEKFNEDKIRLVLRELETKHFMPKKKKRK